MAKPQLQLYSAGTSYIGQLTVTEEMAKEEHLESPQRVIIMDHSGSMGSWSSQMISTVFPQVLDLLGARPDEHLLLILFHTQAWHAHMKVEDLARFQPGKQGMTNMAGVFRELQTQLNPGNPRVQLLALSDGNVNDQAATTTAAASAASVLKASYDIDARAVRLFTSTHGQPDTRALASVLQLNTTTAATLVDLDSKLTLDEMAKRMAGMFAEGSSRGAKLKTDTPMLQPHPWSDPVSEVSLRLGKNTFWLSGRPSQPILNGEPIEVQEMPPMNQDTMSDVLSDRLEFFLSQLKVLKVIDTEQAKEQISRIVNYFQNLEASLAPAEELSTYLEGGGLKNRSVFLRRTFQRRLKSVTTLMESISKDDRVRALNQAQQADYLRQMDTTKNSRALARRAQAAGTDFDATLRKEILQMKAHLDELVDLDASSLSVSFYSQASTLDGIKEVCNLADDSEVFEGLLAVDILRLFNVIGVPCVAPISDFPDPMTYRLEQLMAGNFISVADLSMAEMLGSKLRTPGTDVEIVNAIPFFEDIEIQRFLQRHAPTSMEYICSIGMRRVLAEVPCTFPYTLVAGVWRLIQQLDTDKSELNVQLLSRMVPSYHVSCEGRFEYLIPTLRTDKDPAKSYWIGYNGITNMISPFWRLAEEGVCAHNSRILRALYTFEAFQVMRRLNKQKDPKFPFQTLDRLLGVDFEANGTPLPEMFTRPEPKHTQQFVVNNECLTELSNAMSHTKYATIIPPLFSAVRQADAVPAVRAIPQISSETLSKALDLDFPLEEFVMYNIVEGFLYQSKQARVDKENTKSLRPDLGTRSEGLKMCQDYILSRYSEDYDSRLKQMAGEERKRILDELIKELIEADSMAKFCSLLSEGITRGECSLKIANFSSYGCMELHEALMNIDSEVVDRAKKLYVFYTGEDAEQKSIWNGGNMYRTSTAPLEKLLTSIGEDATWLLILQRYKDKVSHVYRDQCDICNRHGHNNEKPSFFAFGHDTLVSYVGTISSDALAEYKKVHLNCCGMRDWRGEDELRSAVKALEEKRSRRQICESDPAEQLKAIELTRNKRKEKKNQASLQGAVLGKGKGKGNGNVFGKGKANTTSDSDDDHDDDDSDDY